MVAIDGSQESINAAGYAISIAKETTIAAEKHSSELILLHVMPSEVRFGHVSGIFGVVSPEHAERMKQEAHKWFEKIRDRIDSVVSADTLDSYVIFSVLYYLLFVFIFHFTDTNLSQLK